MVLAPWRSPLSRALHRNRALPNARYMQLATVRANGQPANRTVVFRGFLEESDQLQIVTDRRSHKVEQMAQNPWCEVCWYFPKTREQFRLTGTLTRISTTTSDPELVKARNDLWQQLSDNARAQFFWPHPGHPRAEPDAFDSTDVDSTTPPETFDLVLLDPVRVDHLELRGDPQNRQMYERGDRHHWSVQQVNP